MLTRDPYVALLEKRAELYDVYQDPQSASHAPTAVPENDSAASTVQEHNRIKEDNRNYLHQIFPNAGAVQENQSAHLKKLFNDIPKDAIISNPLIKVARDLFFGAIQHGEFLKTASPIHVEMAYRSFCDELEKIAALKPQTMSQLAAKNQMAMARPKVWDLSSPASAAGAAAKPALQGSGTSVHTQGLLGRLFGK